MSCQGLLHETQLILLSTFPLIPQSVIWSLAVNSTPGTCLNTPTGGRCGGGSREVIKVVLSSWNLNPCEAPERYNAARSTSLSLTWDVPVEAALMTLRLFTARRWENKHQQPLNLLRYWQHLVGGAFELYISWHLQALLDSVCKCIKVWWISSYVAFSQV